MTPALHQHIKHIIIALIIIGGGIGAIAIKSKYDAMIADRMAKRDEQIAANQATIKQSQATVDNSQKVITAADLENARQLARIQAELAKKLDSNQAQALIGSLLPGVKAMSTKDAQGNPMLSIPDTQENRDKLNQASGAFKTCQFNLDDCTKARQQYETVIIPEKDKQIKASQNTIEIQGKQIDDLKKFQVPKWTMMVGVGKSQGTNFQDVNSYQPFLAIDYRFAGRFGIFGAAQNKQGAVGLSWRFGSTK